MLPRLLVPLLLAARVASAAFDIAPPQPGTATHPVPTILVSNGDGFLLYWQNQFRDLNTDMVPIDRNGRAGQARTVVSPVIAATRLGDHYLLNVQERDGASGPATRMLYEAAADGSLIAPWRPDLPPDAVIGAIASTVDGEVVFLSDMSVTGRIFVVSRSGVRIATWMLPARAPSDDVQIIGSPNGFLQLTRGVDGLFIQQIPADGSAPGERIRIDAAATSAQDLILDATAASSGDEMVIVWSRGSWSATPQLFSAVVAPDGVVTTRPLPAERVQDLELHWAGDRYVLVGNARRNLNSPAGDSFEMIVLRIDRAGQPLDAHFVTVSAPTGPVWMSAIAFSGSRAYVVGRERSPIGSPFVGVLLSVLDGVTVEAAETIFRRGAAQTFPRAASDGVNSLVVWRESTSEWHSLRARLVSPDGELRSQPVEFSRLSGFMGRHEVAFGGGTYLVVWMYWTHVLAARFDMNGNLLDTAPIEVTGDAEIEDRGRPAISWNGSTFIVAWGARHLVTTTVSSSGVVGAVTVLPAPVGTSDARPALASAGAKTLLAWTRVTSTYFFPCLGCEEYALHTVALDERGVPVNGSERLVAPGGRSPELASNGSDFLVVYQRVRPPLVVEATRITAANEVGPVTIIAVNAAAGAVAAWGGSYAILHSGRDVVALSLLAADDTIKRWQTPAQSNLAFGGDLTVNAAGQILITIPQFVTAADDPQQTWRIIGYTNEDLNRTGRSRLVSR